MKSKNAAMPARKLNKEECTVRAASQYLRKHVGWLDEVVVLSFEHFGIFMEIVLAK